VDKWTAFDGERQLVDPFLKFNGLHRVRELAKRDGERLTDKGLEEGRTARHAIDLQALLQPELDQYVEAGYMVDMEMGKEEKDRLFLRNVPVGLRNPVTGVEDKVIVPCLHQYGNRIAGRSIEPAVRTKEGDLHISCTGISQVKKGTG
jgi:hypothetical protein